MFECKKYSYCTWAPKSREGAVMIAGTGTVMLFGGVHSEHAHGIIKMSLR
jgi:hypothetical protein